MAFFALIFFRAQTLQLVIFVRRVLLCVLRVVGTLWDARALLLTGNLPFDYETRWKEQVRIGSTLQKEVPNAGARCTFSFRSQTPVLD